MSELSDSFQTNLKGDLIDSFTRCVHYNSTIDIIAIKFKCCKIFYPCYECHMADCDHVTERWTTEDLKSEKVVLCGVCKKELTFNEYNGSGYVCIYCSSRFNPKCSLHYPLYFDLS